MATNTQRRILTSVMAAVLLVTTIIGAVSAAPMAQNVESQEVEGTIAGGQFAEVWLGLETDIQGNNINVLSEWNRNEPASNGLGFYVLTTEQMAKVLAGSNPSQNNLAAGTALGSDFPANVTGADFRGTSDSYTIIVYNDSPNDAEFKLTAANAMITDDSGNVMAVGAEEEMMDETDAEDTAAADDATEADATEADAEEATADSTTEDDEAATEEAAATDEEAVAEDEETATADDEAPTEAPASVVSTTPKVVEAQELNGELPEQYDQHYLGLEPSVKDGLITLVYAFGPQDSSELATRTGFWVMEQDDFNIYLDPDGDVELSALAIAAGSNDAPELLPNERSASFTASGIGPYTVVVFNNSTVPASYTLRVDGGKLIDDSGQTISMDDEEMTDEAVDVDEEATDEADADATVEDTVKDTVVGREGEPGGTYIVQAGDSLSLISDDIYGEIGYWEDICDYNQLDSCDAIEVGDVLQLPTLDELGTDATATATSTDTSADDAAETTTETDTAAAEDVADTTADEESTTLDATESITDTATTTDTAEVDSTTEVTDTESTADATGSDTNIVQQLEAAGNFETLVSALQEAGLADALESAGPFTVFAPTDEAFDELPSGAMNSLLKDPNGYLTEILLFHVLDGELVAADMVDGEREVTQQGQSLGFEVSEDGIKVNGANIVLEDIDASNGVIQALDAVILPPNQGN